MTDPDTINDDYDHYEALFDPMRSDRRTRRKRKPKMKHIPKKSHRQIIEEIADPNSIEAGFETTYVPGLFEQGWLLESLRPFYDQDLITDVLARVQGGKEANVYRCAAHPGTGFELLAAKVYRPRMFRNLRNDKMYREGRAVLTEDGKEVKETDHRIMRALNKKTTFGAQVQHTSWLMHEYTTLQKLHAAGAAVPQAVAAGENAILMTYHGGRYEGAPTLHEVALDRDEAALLFREVIDNVELMLSLGLIHGDLSAYNILYWEGDITLIDFPQVTHCRGNGQAHFILERDITRVCEYFTGQGISSSPRAILDDLWRRYVELKPQDKAADESRWLERD